MVKEIRMKKTEKYYSSPPLSKKLSVSIKVFSSKHLTATIKYMTQSYHHLLIILAFYL